MQDAVLVTFIANEFIDEDYLTESYFRLEDRGKMKRNCTPVQKGEQKKDKEGDDKTKKDKKTAKDESDKTKKDDAEEDMCQWYPDPCNKQPY